MICSRTPVLYPYRIFTGFSVYAILFYHSYSHAVKQGFRLFTLRNPTQSFLKILQRITDFHYRSGRERMKRDLAKKLAFFVRKYARWYYINQSFYSVNNVVLCPRIEVASRIRPGRKINASR